MSKKIKTEIKALRENSHVAYIGSVNEDGYPQIKGMLVIQRLDFRKVANKIYNKEV